MNVSLRNTTESFWLIILTAISCTFSICRAQEIHFEHVVIDREAIGHREVGDIDGDGFNDIAAVNYPMLVWYEYPDWKKHLVADISKFDDYKTYRACDMELADIDGDRDLDVVGRIGRPKDDQHGVNCWFENPRPNRNPAKGPWKRHDIGKTEYVKDIEVRDFDKDGRPDVVVRMHTKVCLYLQKSSDSWTAVWMNVHDHEGMEVADLDRDGDPDIILNGFWLECPPNPAADKWLEHNIDQKWWTQKTGSWQDNNCKVTVADMNKDGCLDVLLSHSEKAGYPVSWYEAPGDSTKGPWKEHVIGHVDKCHNLKAADFDRDGDLDVFAAEMPNIPKEAPHPVIVFTNQGDARRWKQQILAKQGNYSAQVGDIDNDGDIDIIGLRNHNRAPIEMWRNKTSPSKLSLDDWTYIEIDNKRARRHFGLSMADVTGDGYEDIVSGRYFYRNPGGDMTTKWQRADFGFNVDGMLFVDVDGDKFGDAIAEALPDVYWLEAQDRKATRWKAIKIGTLPQTGHVNGQGYALAQIVASGKREIILSAGDGIYYFQIPDNPAAGNWPRTRIAPGTSEEGIGVGDIDGDGNIDIAAGIGKDREGKTVAWWKNPGNGKADWKPCVLGTTVSYADRFAIADISGDRRLDIIVSEETRKSNANLFWFEQPSDPTRGNWNRHLVVEQYTMNSMDAADMDSDGDTDIIINEHRGDKRVQIWENDGRGNFTVHLVGQGKEGHLGARVADLDNDGDLDIVSIAWDSYALLHLWRNDAKKRNPMGRNWPFEYNVLQDFHPVKTGHSGESAIVDINQDDKPDIWFNANNGESNLYQMAWYKNPTWRLYRIAKGNYLGGNWVDIDGDGDMDLVTSKSDPPRMYVWLENTGNPEHRDWPEHVIDKGRINADATHFADLNRDGRKDIIVMTFRHDVYYLPTPVDPKKGPWNVHNVRHSDHARTGGSLGDVDSDGDIDIVWGNGWLQNHGDPTKVPWPDHIIDSNWNHDAQSAVADIDKDGSSDVVLAGEESFDGIAWYKREPATGKWIKHKIAATGYEGVHSLQVADFDRDGDMDVFCAEMHQSGYIRVQEPHKITVFENYDIKTNNWKEHIIATTGSHNARVGDINGDKYPDIVGSNWNNRLQKYPLKAEVWISKIGQK